MSFQLLFVIFAAFVCSWKARSVGGSWNMLGTCAKAFTCRHSNHAGNTLWSRAGICLRPANAQCTKGEGCREYWSRETGGTVYCCPGRGRLVINGTSGDCICNGTGNNVFSWSEIEQFVEGYKLLPTGAQCTIGEGCREHLSCKTGGTVHCCPWGERLEVNGTSGVCTCIETSSKLKGFRCGGGTLGQGNKFWPTKPADQDYKKNTTCYGESSCSVGNTRYCCPMGHVTTVSRDGELQSCNCRYDFSGRTCTTSFASPHVTSASALTCVAASLVALLFASFMPDK